MRNTRRNILMNYFKDNRNPILTPMFFYGEELQLDVFDIRNFYIELNKNQMRGI